MKRALPLLAFGALVLGALVFLILRLRGGAPVAPTARRPSRPQVVDQRRTADAGPRASAAAPADNRGSSPPAARADAGSAPAADPSASPVQRITVANTRLAIRPIVKRCAVDHAAELEPRARLTARVETVIAGGQLTLAAIELDARALPPDGELVGCVRRGLEGFSLAVPGHADVARHPMRFPFDLPLR